MYVLLSLETILIFSPLLWVFNALYIEPLRKISPVRKVNISSNSHITILQNHSAMHKTRGLKTDIRLAEPLVPVGVGVTAAGVDEAEAVVVELAEVSPGVALTSPALEHRLKALLLFATCVIVAWVWVWA